MSHLGDDAEAFFQQGDDGTYEGGPKSLSPSTRDVAHEEDDLTTEVTPELLERRDRLQRIVKGVVGTLGACVLVLLPLRLGSAEGSSTASAATAIELSTPAAPVVVAPAHASVANLPVVADALPATPPASIVAHAAPVEDHRVVTQRHAAQKPVTARAPSSTRHLGAHVASRLQHGAVRTAAPSTNASLRTGARRASAVHVPPTASFPD